MQTFIVTVESGNNINTAVIICTENRNEALKRVLDEFEGAVSVRVYDMAFDVETNTWLSNWKPLKQEVCLSIEGLYKAFGENLSFGKIRAIEDKDGSYFDFYNRDGELACCDGEIVVIVSCNDHIYTLQNDDMKFKLTKQEFITALI